MQALAFLSYLIYYSGVTAPIVEGDYPLGRTETDWRR